MGILNSHENDKHASCELAFANLDHNVSDISAQSRPAHSRPAFDSPLTEFDFDILRAVARPLFCQEPTCRLMPRFSHADIGRRIACLQKESRHGLMGKAIWVGKQLLNICNGILNNALVSKFANNVLF